MKTTGARRKKSARRYQNAAAASTEDDVSTSSIPSPSLPFSIQRLDGRTAFVTGASAGIGAACAGHLAALGANVVLGARRQERLDAVKASIVARVPGARVFAAAVDVTDAAAVDAWLAAGSTALGDCDILVDNAGLALGRAHAADLVDADVDTMFDVNVRAAIRLVQRVLPGMKQRAAAGRPGDLVLMASIAGTEPYAGGSIYCATKAAVQAFARSVRAELLGTDIRVLTIDPGLVETEFSIVRNRGDVAAANATYKGLEALTADDVADTVAFALTRPRRMSLDRVQVLASAQLGTQSFFRS
ncbi:MAG TPA: SDR family NAD(P)-dependent oxidoreductase [Myxococcota bacterium]